jgi:lipopolysaccharide/colanic/teichoic acid biosynthesis glycosyltransferase
MSWLTPIIALLIKIDSKGPVLFRQLRSGENGLDFWCIKFRSMRSNIDANRKQATKDDPRITKLGAFLRKSSIDEFPQFLNVFWGDMSVVGPRPHMLKHTEEYASLISFYMGRHHVKPGITGLAQCMGYRGETQTVQDMKNRVRLDRYYIENWSFWLDIKIIFLTVVSLLRGSDKAY